MDDNDKTFVWTSKLCKKLFQLRYQNDWLFKSKRQPWSEFHNVLLENGFPTQMTVDQVRKKWSYSYNMYKAAKKANNTSWPYYKLFENIFKKAGTIDKYESWDDDWRLKLILSISEAKDNKLDVNTMWRTVERALRCQDLPIDCCVQDLKLLWQHIRMTFNRKHRIALRKGQELTEWPLYEPMLTYFQKFEPEYLIELQTQAPSDLANNHKKPKSMKTKEMKLQDDVNENEFHWSKDMTETFIQVRFQNDWLFREKKWVWNDFTRLLIEEYGFPKYLTPRSIARKWAATFGEYQRAKATNNTSWLYYKLFEVYLDESNLTVSPHIDWQEEWVFNLISSRTDLDHMFTTSKEQYLGWREVEKRLRMLGLPLDHSLFDIIDIWTHLLKTWKWKQKFANKGLLNEHWPYFEAMTRYWEIKRPIKNPKLENKEFKVDFDVSDDVTPDFDDDDIKLIDLKQKLSVPKLEVGGLQCRTCSVEVDSSVDIFEEKDNDGLDVACKLRVICGVQVDQTDNYPKRICHSCLEELENAYKFRRKCQEIDKQYRDAALNIKIEVLLDKQEEVKDNDAPMFDAHDLPYEPDSDNNETLTLKPQPVKVRAKRKKPRKLRYEYWKICEVCGKSTRDLKSHIDTHATDKLHACDVCDRKFKCKSSLGLHRASHHSAPKKTCEVCGKSFHVMASYRKHFMYHANERRFACDTCGKRFNSSDILKVHVRIHTDERPFSCSECGKTFRTAGCVARHKRIVHKNIRK